MYLNLFIFRSSRYVFLPSLCVVSPNNKLTNNGSSFTTLLTVAFVFVEGNAGGNIKTIFDHLVFDDVESSADNENRSFLRVIVDLVEACLVKNAIVTVLGA